jgi:sulfopyruvate decarboxylase subunit alpha
MINVDPSTAVYCGLKQAGIDFVASVPCINLKGLLPKIASDPDIIWVPVTREEEGVGICAGAWLGGKRPALLMQNSGLGNSINALASLDLLYGIPLLMVISHRGGLGEKMVGQIPMGRLTEPILELMSIPCFAPDPMSAEKTIVDAWNAAKSEGVPAAILLEIGFWS